MSVIKQYQGHTTKAELFKWVDFPRSSYYYKPSNNRKGIAPSTSTAKRDGTIVSNEAVVEEIKKVLSAEFVCYGYQNVTAVLRSMDYIINHKKVYRLMDESYMDFYNNKRLHGSLKRKTPIQVWNEYYQSLSTDMHQTAQVSEELSRVSDCADTGLALDKSGDAANFANRLMNENNETIKHEVLNPFIKICPTYRGLRHSSSKSFIS